MSHIDLPNDAGKEVPEFGLTCRRNTVTMPISISTIVVGTHLVVAVADQVPAFDIVRSCKLDTAATTAPSVDQSLKNCVDDENRLGKN